jgi:hypothetical protein
VEDLEDVELNESGAMQEAALTRAEGERLADFWEFWSFGVFEIASTHGS